MLVMGWEEEEEKGMDQEAQEAGDAAVQILWGHASPQGQWLEQGQ